jgi:transcriptional regulator with XRE-family HTH domain
MNFAVSELSAVRLSTRPDRAVYNRPMSNALKTYFDAERGRAARLADDLEISRSYVSDLAAGKKTASVPLLRRISEKTGLSLQDLMGDNSGFSESDVAPYIAGPKGNRLRDLAVMLFPASRHPSYYIARRDHLAFAITSGDLLVTEAQFDPDKLESGQLVVANLVTDDSEPRTLVARTALPWLVDGSGHIAGEIGRNASVLGIINIVLRSADPAAF